MPRSDLAASVSALPVTRDLRTRARVRIYARACARSAGKLKLIKKKVFFFGLLDLLFIFAVSSFGFWLWFNAIQKSVL